MQGIVITADKHCWVPQTLYYRDIVTRWRDTLSYWAALLSDTVRSCRLSFFGHLHHADHSQDHYHALHYGSSWWLETEDWPSQTILAENSGGWPANNEPQTGDVEVVCSGQIDMAETHDNDYVYNKLLKRREIWFRLSRGTKLAIMYTLNHTI